MTSAILLRICELLKEHAAFNSLQVKQDIYPVPVVYWPSNQGELTIQVCDGGAETLDADGSVLRQDFTLVVAYFVNRPLDYTERQTEHLISQTDSIYMYRDAIQEVLHGSFLPTKDALDQLLVRPLVLRRQSENEANPNENSMVRRRLLFTAGLNEEQS